MRYFFIPLLLVMLGLGSAAVARELPQPKLIAVYFYADWCVNCKPLAAAMDEARNVDGLYAKDVLFVTLDLTDKPRIHQSVLHAQALGIGEFLKAQGSATGYVVLLDAASKKELVRFDRESTADDIRAAFQKYLGT